MGRSKPLVSLVTFLLCFLYCRFGHCTRRIYWLEQWYPKGWPQDAQVCINHINYLDTESSTQSCMALCGPANALWILWLRPDSITQSWLGLVAFYFTTKASFWQKVVVKCCTSWPPRSWWGRGKFPSDVPNVPPCIDKGPPTLSLLSNPLLSIIHTVDKGMPLQPPCPTLPHPFNLHSALIIILKITCGRPEPWCDSTGIHTAIMRVSL